MRVIVLAFTLKGQNKEDILKIVRSLKEQYNPSDTLCIHGFMPRKLLIEKNIPTDVIDAIEETFPMIANCHNGEEPHRGLMGVMSGALSAEVLVIGEIKEGVAEEINIYRNNKPHGWEPKIYNLPGHDQPQG